MSQSHSPKSKTTASWSDVVKQPSSKTLEQAKDHEMGHSTAQSRDPPPNTSYADLATPSAAQASFSTSARKFAQGQGDPVAKVMDRVEKQTVHSGTGQSAPPSTTSSSSASTSFPSLHDANPHSPDDVDPVIAPLIDDTVAQQATRDVPVEIVKATGSADIKQGGAAAAAEPSSSAAVPPVKQTDLGRALDQIQPRHEEPTATLEPPEPVVPLTETPRGGTAVNLGVIEATQQNVPIRTSGAAAEQPRVPEKSEIDKATGGFVPGTQERIESTSYATTWDQPEFGNADKDTGESDDKQVQQQVRGPSEIEKATGGFVPGTQERIQHASGTSAPPPTPIGQADPLAGNQGAEAQVPLLPETLAHPAVKAMDKAKEWLPTSADVKSSVGTATSNVSQAMGKVKDAMPTAESVSAVVQSASSATQSTAASAADKVKSVADQASATVADTASQAQATALSAYESAASTASSAVDSLKSTLLSAEPAADNKPLSHAERAEALLEQIQDVAAIGPDAVRASLAAGSSSVESGSVGGSTGPTPAKEDAISAASHGRKLSPEEAAEARASHLLSRFGGGGASAQSEQPLQPMSAAAGGGGNTVTSGHKLAASTDASKNRAEEILATYEEAATVGPDAVRAALSAGTTASPRTHYPHDAPSKPAQDVPPKIAQRILEQARASIDQLTSGGHSEVDLVASDEPSSSSSTTTFPETTLGEGLDYAASFARGVRAGMTQAAKDVEQDVYETIRKTEGQLAIPTEGTRVQESASDTVHHHRAEDAKEALAPVVTEGPVETIVHAAENVVTKVEYGLLSIAESVGLYHGSNEPEE